MQKELEEFSLWVYEPSRYFEEESIYPELTKYTLNLSTYIGKGGILVFDDVSNYLVSSNQLYNQISSSQNKSMIAMNEDVLISNFSSQTISYEILSQNKLEDSYLSIENKTIYFPFLDLNYISSENAYTYSGKNVEIKIDENSTYINDYTFSNDSYFDSFEESDEENRVKFHAVIKTRVPFAL